MHFHKVILNIEVLVLSQNFRLHLVDHFVNKLFWEYSRVIYSTYLLNQNEFFQ